MRVLDKQIWQIWTILVALIVCMVRGHPLVIRLVRVVRLASIKTKNSKPLAFLVEKGRIPRLLRPCRTVRAYHVHREDIPPRMVRAITTHAVLVHRAKLGIM